MSESNNVKFVEANGKWLWKRYNEDGSVIYRSSLFNTEREAREDYELNGDKQDDAGKIIEGAKDIQVEQNSPENTTNTDTVQTQPEDANTAGSATVDENQEKQPEDNGVGQATI